MRAHGRVQLRGPPRRPRAHRPLTRPPCRPWPLFPHVRSRLPPSALSPPTGRPHATTAAGPASKPPPPPPPPSSSSSGLRAEQGKKRSISSSSSSSSPSSSSPLPPRPLRLGHLRLRTGSGAGQGTWSGTMGACVRRTEKTIDARQRKLGGEEQRGGVGSRLRHCAAPLHLVQHLEATLICQARCARWPSIQLYGRTAATALAESSAQRRRSMLGSDERTPNRARERPQAVSLYSVAVKSEN